MTGPRLEPSYAPTGESTADLWVERSNLNGMALSLVAYGKAVSPPIGQSYVTKN